ncbi:MAG: mechanosensitive ion channel family protein [Bauldia sp.]|nr:mechanosensitive ion channel family protein [Bauldia sp.]
MDITEAPEEISALALAFWTWAVEFLPRFGAALLIVVVGYFVAGWVARAAASAVKTTGKVDSTLHPVIHSVVRYSILVLVGVAALGQLGVQTTSLLAVLGAAGLAIGLALQGTLSNIAAGMMILWLRPFRAGDFIETADVAGTVEEIGLFHAQMRTWDGIYKFVPNSQLWNVILTNYTRNPTRMMQIEVGIDYDADLARGREVMTETARKHPGVLDDPPPLVVPLAFADSSVNLQLRAWAPTATYWDVRWEVTQNIKRDLEATGIGIPFPQRVVHMVGADTVPAPPAKIPARKPKPRAARAGDEEKASGPSDRSRG